MKKTIIFLLLIALLQASFCAVVSGASANSVCGCTEGGYKYGNGTFDSPYQITTVEELLHIEKHPNACYVLQVSLNLGEVDMWKPLCSEIPFSGDFNGNGETLNGLYVRGGEKCGLFASVAEKAAIYNLTVKGNIWAGSNTEYAGALAAESYGAIKQITSDVDITVSSSSAATVGGIVGFNGGFVISSSYTGNVSDNGNGKVGAIIGESKVTNTSLLPTMITGHSGFGKSNDPSYLKQDNTITNIIHSVNYGPDAIEVDVRSYNNNGVTEIWLGHNSVDVNNGASLETVLNLLMGNHVNSQRLDPKYADKVRIQLDAKQNGILDDIFAVIDKVGFPYERIILAGDNQYSHVVDNIDKIRAAVDKGMDFWMNPNFILSYDAMANQTDEFIAKIKALGLSSFTVNSNYNNMTETIQRKLNAEGINISIWTLNSEEVLSAHMLRGAYNITSRLQESLAIRDQIRMYGTAKNTFTGLPEIAVCENLKTDAIPNVKVPNDDPVNEEITENVPEQTGTEAQNDTQTEAEKSGCGSAIGGSALALMAASACVAALPRKKKRD